MRGPADAKLEVDGKIVLAGSACGDSGTADERRVDLVLARGLHDVRLSGTLADAGTRLVARWASGPGKPPAPFRRTSSTRANGRAERRGLRGRRRP